MWFKQVQLFQLTESIRLPLAQFIEKLDALAFTSCLPSMPYSSGWIAPADEDGAPLAQMMNNNFIFCLQIEEKILPAAVIRQELADRIKQIQTIENRKIYQNEKMALKDDIIATLLPRAFSKLTRIYAYIDTTNNWLVLGTNNKKKTEQFISLFKKSITDNVFPFQIKKLSKTITQWLKTHNNPPAFAIEKACVLQDPNEQSRVIRCQQQNLFADGIQAILKEGCEVKSLAFTWQDRVSFVLAEDFSLSGIKFQDEIIAHAEEMEAETQQQVINADFLIMSETFAGLFKELLDVFLTLEETNQKSKLMDAHPA